MKLFFRPAALAFACAALALVCAGVGIKHAAAQTVHIEELVDERGPSPKLELTPAQQNAIYQEVHKGRSKAAPTRFASDVGADVPPIIDLYALPDDILATNPETQPYKFAEVDDQVVLVDPTKMRVICEYSAMSRSSSHNCCECCEHLLRSNRENMLSEEAAPKAHRSAYPSSEGARD